MERTVESIIKEMEQTGIMMKPKMTNAQRLSGLQDYQELILRMVYNEDHAENLRLWDVIDHFQKLALDKGYSENETVLAAIADMETVAKEIAIAISGVSGERQVAHSLQYARRNILTLQNINLQDGEDKTELDQIVITSNGILILEVKNYKKDVTISEAGQIYGPCGKRYCDKNLGEQMNIKRYLLCTKLEQALEETAPDLGVHIESRVVFSDPNITVTDLYQQEAYCFKTNLPHVVEQLRSDVHYSREQMRAIADIIRGFAEEDDTYDVGFDFDRIRRTFAEALIILEGDFTCEEGAEQELEQAEAIVIPAADPQEKSSTPHIGIIIAVSAGILTVAGLATALIKKH